MKLTKHDKEQVSRYVRFLGDFLMAEPDCINYVSTRTRVVISEDTEEGDYETALNIAAGEAPNLPALFFNIAHEMRHLCQIESLSDNESNWFENDELKTIRKEMEDAKEADLFKEMDARAYNGRLVEMDANAFAYAFMAVVFGIDIHISPENTDVKKIMDRAARIAQNDLTAEDLKDSARYADYDINEARKMLYSSAGVRNNG